MYNRAYNYLFITYSCRNDLPFCAFVLQVSIFMLNIKLLVSLYAFDEH